jgi:NAD(P)-dependent dehydrogenase (short-subunit alcohol dehydrogenase family)
VNENKVWLVTGAGRGLGADVARAALAEGHSVIATGRDTRKVAAAVGDQEHLLTVKLDVTRPQDADAAVDAL